MLPGKNYNMVAKVLKVQAQQIPLHRIALLSGVLQNIDQEEYCISPPNSLVITV